MSESAEPQLLLIPGRSKKLVWHGAHDPLEIAGFTLRSPMLYVQEKLSRSEPSAVSPHSEIEPVPELYLSNPFAARIAHPTYYPSWENLNPQARWIYLWWNEQGRSFFPSQSGYVYLFLYGLERRALMDGADTGDVWDEVFRLHSLCTNAYSSFRYHSEKLLWFLLAKDPTACSETQILQLLRSMTAHRNYVSEELNVAMHWFGSRELTIPAEAAYHIAAAMGSSDGVVVQRAEPELRQLFYHRFNERYGSGLSIEFMAKRQATIGYYASNALLPRRGQNVSFPNPMGHSKRYEKLSWLLQTCADDLRRFAIALGKEPAGRDSPVVWEAMPVEIRPAVHPSRRRLQAYLDEVGQLLDEKLVEAGQLNEVLGLGFRKGNFSAEQGRRLATAVDASGFRLEPDSRLSGRGYEESQVVLLYESTSPAATNTSADAVARYQGGLFLLRAIRALLGAEPSPGSIPSEPLEYVLNNYTANPAEVERFRAAWFLLATEGIAISTIRVPTAWAAAEREAAGRMLLQLGTRNGRVSGDVEAVLRALWKKLGLTPGLLNRELDVLSANGVVFLGNVVPSRGGERLPPPPFSLEGKPQELTLNKDTIAALLEDTRHVQQSLLDAMQAQEEVPEVQPTPEPVTEPAPTSSDFADLPPRYEPLLHALLQRPSWTETEAKELAREHRLMLSGAIEAINDWSVELHGEPLIWHEDTGYTVERSLLA